MFRLARDLRKTVRELMTGVPGPLSGEEYAAWAAFYNLEAQDQARARKR